MIHAFLTLVLGGDEWIASRPGHFTSGERALGTHWIGGWVGHRSDKMSHHCSRREMEPTSFWALIKKKRN
jgi:hypothetical protein